MLAMGVVAIAAPALAQDATPVVKLEWYKEIDQSRLESRFGAGFGGKVYYNDKANGKVMTVDKDGNVAEFAAVEGLGVGISIDDAGNVLVNTGFPNAATATNYVIISADGTTQTPLTLTINEENAANKAARVEQISRVVGNLLSEEGAFFFLSMDGALNVTTVFVQNGAQADGDLSYLFSAPVADTGADLNTSTVCQPMYSFDELVDMGDDARMYGFCFRNRNNQNINYYVAEGETGVWKKFAKPAGVNSCEGFDIINNNGTYYTINPIKVSKNYENYFVLADEEGKVIFDSSKDGAPSTCDTGSQSFGSFMARMVDDTKAEIYQWYGANNNKCMAAMYTVDFPQGVNDVISSESNEAPVYYNLQGVRVANPENGLYIKVVGEKATKVLVK